MIYSRNDLRYVRWVNEAIWVSYVRNQDRMEAIYERSRRKGDTPVAFGKLLGAPAILGGWLNEPDSCCDGWCKF